MEKYFFLLRTKQAQSGTSATTTYKLMGPKYSQCQALDCQRAKVLKTSCSEVWVLMQVPQLLNILPIHYFSYD